MQSPTGGKIIEVEPAAAGPDIKPVRQKKPLTEAQKAALQKGRERLAERRKQMKEEHGGSATQTEVVVTTSHVNNETDHLSTSSLDSDQEEEADAYDDAQSTAYCSMM